jgi:serine/threonine-protein kinase
MGQVHVARHASGRRVVVKRLRDTLALDPRLMARLGDEGRVSRRVCHPNVVRVYEHGVSADGTPFIVMEHARGTTLRKLVLEQGPLTLARIRGLVAQLLAGLAAIHDAGIVHADIKSNNIIVDTVHGVDHLTIIDFGLARTRTSQGPVNDDGIVVGTPEYIAPEMLRGEAPSVRSDLYSAAIVAYELIVGLTPFGGGDVLEVLRRQISEPIELPAAARALLSPQLERVVLRALDNPRRFYDDTLSGSEGFWIWVLPGVIHKHQPLFNEAEPMWHLDGVTFPLLEPMPAAAPSPESH